MKKDCATDPAVNAVWIAALEWVLGDEAHRRTYDEWLQLIAAPLGDTGTPADISLRHALRIALERLR